MIFGIGTDIIQIARIEAALMRSGDRFAEKILGIDELGIYHARKGKGEARGLRFLATRFAAKEALSKALGLGMRDPMSWRSVQTLNNADGMPFMIASGRLFDWMEMQGLSARVTVSDEIDYALAFVIVEQRSII
ncbi:holo-ACP synthase [soil metagenome]